ncbi:Com family DNA-binding transcriptional regulator [Neptuniibacter sp.]|uniref:Com family DNA-binding transcriptional regulator n=1 Tax=Neptuniibacter sp. TaxID=1962643 RepID=UPI003B5B15D0
MRCSECKKLLAIGVWQTLQIKCPRCGHINERTMSPMEKEPDNGKTSRALDRRQAQTG